MDEVKQNPPIPPAETTSRAGWAEAAAQAHRNEEDILLDPPVLTEFDEKEWTWGPTGSRN